ncbi:DoxX family protein [Flavobacterium amnicola]|uniref:DoxX family protein n=1 Tax=Flavobacterium amnicola TaxID=2506422 RepID=A0A4Q1K671_9FLAO|nr:DoxX family protein [Flavobacterium amnicola]
MKLATTIIRVLLGALLLFASLMFFLKLAPEPEVTGDFKAFNVGLVASKYIIPLAKGVELLCGISFITNKFVALANLVILPVSLNIFLINFFLSPESLPIAIFICFANLFLIYRYWDHYKGLIEP